MNNIKLFESLQIRTVWNETDQNWYFVAGDVVLVLTDSNNPKQYMKPMRRQDEELAKGWGYNLYPPLRWIPPVELKKL